MEELELTELELELELELEDVAELGGGLPLKVSGCPPQADNVRIKVPTKKLAKGSLLMPIICLARKIDD